MSILRRGLRVMTSDGIDRLFLLLIRYLSAQSNYHRRVRKLPIPVSRFVFWWTAQSVRAQTTLFRRLFSSKYTDADPYKLIYVDPNDIVYISGLHDQKRRGWVIDGDWDLECRRFDEQPLPKSIHSRFINGSSWEDTPLAENYENKVDFEKECQKIEELYRSISEHGFKTQTELTQRSEQDTFERANATISPFTNEITVDIGRNGEILWNMLGKHRLSIAQVLNINEVPALVFTRHKKWNKHRDKVSTSRSMTKQLYVEHPDLRDIL